MTAAPAPSGLRHQLPLLVWLVVVWILLWGTWSWANVVSGVVVGLLVMLLLPLPPVVGGTRVRPLSLAAVRRALPGRPRRLRDAGGVAGARARAGCSRGRSCGCSCAPTPTCC